MTFKNSTAVYVQVQFPLSKEIKIRSHRKVTTADSILSKRYMVNVKTFEYIIIVVVDHTIIVPYLSALY